MTYGLVTVSSPFNGIAAASDCGSRLYHALSLGITVGVCQAVTGAKWIEIHPRAALVTAPPALLPAVQDHLTVMTDERESCRRAGPDGRCLEDDFVFSLEEQAIDRLRFDRRVQTEEVAAGHVEIVGAPGVRPAKLLSILKRHGILEQTPSGKELGCCAACSEAPVLLALPRRLLDHRTRPRVPRRRRRPVRHKGAWPAMGTSESSA
jgi:hypothetical protein